MIFRAILFALATAAVIGGLAYWLKCLCLCDYENACDYSQCDSCPFPGERHNCGEGEKKTKTINARLVLVGARRVLVLQTKK